MATNRRSSGSSRKSGSRKKSGSTKPAYTPVTSSDANIQPYLQAINSLAGNDSKVAAGLLGGAQLGSTMYAPGSMGRVDESMSPEMQEIFNRYKAESYLGGNQQSEDTTRGLELQRQAAENASLSNPQVQAALGYLSQAAGDSSLSNPAIKAALDRADATAASTSTMNSNLSSILDERRKQYRHSGEIDPMVQELINLRKSGLEGLSSAEMTAAREQGQSELNRSMGTALRNLKISQLGGGPRGQSSMIGAVPIVSNFANAQQGLERKLILDNYDAKQNALGAYSDLIQDVDKNRYARQQQTLDSLSGDTSNFNNDFIKNRLAAQQAADASRQGYMGLQQSGAGNFASGLNAANQNAANTAGTYGNNAADVYKFNINDRESRFNNFINFYGNMRTDLYNRQLENLNRLLAEKSGMSTSILGGGAFASEQAGRSENFELGKENLKLQQSMFGGRGGGSSNWGTGNKGSSSSGGTSTTNSDAFG